MRGSPFVAALIDPAPGRFARAAEIAVACTLVMIVSMTYEIPQVALSTYLVFFAAKTDAGLNIVTSVIFIVLVSIVSLLLIPAAAVTDALPDLRLPLIAVLSFLFFFLSVTSKLAPVASTLGLIMADLLYTLASVPDGELSIRGLLDLPLIVGMPMAVFIAYNIVFGRRPDRLVRRAVAARLDLAAAALKERARTDDPLGSALAGGNAALLSHLAMTKLFHFQPDDTRERLRQLVVLSYALVMAVAALATDTGSTLLDEALAVRAGNLATRIRHLPRLVAARRGDDEAPLDHPTQIMEILDLIERVATGGAHADLGPAPTPKPHAGFFAPDAFTAPRYVRHALKATAAVLVCYLTIVILDWSKISTCIITVFVVALPSVGETVQKLTLRIAGACLGGFAGLAAIVYLLPDATSIADLAPLILLATLPPAWIAAGAPTVSYLGFQIAFAFFLCVLQGSAPAFDLAIARDRIVGILFGDVVVFLIFANLFPASLLVRLKGEVARLVEACRAALASVSQGRPALERAARVAEAEALLGKIGLDAAAFGFEGGQRQDRRLQAQATRLNLRALRGLVTEIARIAALPSPAEPSGAVASAWRRDCAALEARLGAIADRLSGRPVSETDVAPPATDASEGPATDPRALALLRTRVDRVDVALARYGRVLRAQGRSGD